MQLLASFLCRMDLIYAAFSVLPEKRLFQEDKGLFLEQRLVIEPSFCTGLGQCRVELLFGIVLWDGIWTQFLAQLCINFPLHEDFLSFARSPTPPPPQRPRPSIRFLMVRTLSAYDRYLTQTD